MNPKLHMHRLRFVTNPDEEQGGGKPEDETEEQPQEGGAEDNEGDENDDDKGEESESEESEETRRSKDPEYLAKELERTRAEAANYRTQLREAQAKLEGAKTPEEVQAVVAELTQKIEEGQIALSRERIARQFDLPDEIASLLQGKSEDELRAHAKKLAPLVGASGKEGDPKGGLNPDDEADDIDPVAWADKLRARRF